MERKERKLFIIQKFKKNHFLDSLRCFGIGAESINIARNLSKNSLCQDDSI